MTRNNALISRILIGIQIIFLACSAMWFDDEISNWYHHTITPIFESSTQSPNVTVLENYSQMETLQRQKNIRIYTPTNYKNSDERYPVLYMLGGQRLFDQKTTSRDEQHIDEILDEAIVTGGQPIIVVAIDGSEFRDTELNPYDYRNAERNEADLYLEWLVNDLKPQIDREFRTLTDREHTGIMGASLGGLFSFYAIMKHSEVFSKAGCLSPSVLHSAQVYELPNQLENENIQLYFNMGKHEFSGLKTTTRLLVRDLRDMGFGTDRLQFDVVEKGGHDPITWQAGFEAAYPWFFGQKST